MNLTTLEGSSSLSSLAERYRKGEAGVCGLFGSHPSHPSDWRLRAEALDRTEAGRMDRSRLAGALRAYQRRLKPSAEVDRSIDELASGNALAVVGGQQAGLFGGALLIVYKALTVIQAAKYARELLQRPVVPVFWIAGEDHDYDEANHVYVAGQDGAPKRIRIERPEGPRNAVSRTPLTRQQWNEAIEELAAELPDTEHKPFWIEKIRSHTEDEPTLTLAFARLLSEWFGSEGLVLLDADDPELRSQEGAFFRRLIERNDELESSLKEGEMQVRELGLPIQAEAAKGCANLFVHGDSGRLLLYKKDGNYGDRKDELSLTCDELLEMAERSPDRLSNNALTRPLMQEYALPVLATVLGPSELAYWGVLGPAFASFGMSLPLLLPRQSFTFVDPGIVKLLEKYEVDAESVMEDGAKLKADWLARQDDWRLEDRFGDVRRQFADLYAPLLETLAAVQPDLKRLGENNRERILDQIAYLEKRATDVLAKRHESALKQWDQMSAALQPQGKPQERVLGAIHFLNRYGPEWLEVWKEVPYDVTGGHRLVFP
ncbi:bacillithiol biosynthesis cysteine-adding enzyme BshC [Cohnella zeiphila]|uniref:Putative cysteine ligase BshC n=1 Tax=Cohnella zeiphila TaxID=2761120 RepID=A0A7X0SJ67_9BACL|nr:bacillithiol biosynthesis cysteine-adding enzyme BshC [Cohnella zeiphila]MBB6729660.1 bacillithiol biosynthesis cysteine-adding enzyme BshC [Cohnella zeiphila]